MKKSKRILAITIAMIMILTTLPAFAVGILNLPTGANAMSATEVGPANYNYFTAFLTDYLEYLDPDMPNDGKDAEEGARVFYANLVAATGIDLLADGINADDFAELYRVISTADTNSESAILGDLIGLASSNWAGPRDNLMASANFVDDSAYVDIDGSKAAAYYLYIMEVLQNEDMATYDSYTDKLTGDFGDITSASLVNKYDWDAGDKTSFDADDTMADFIGYLFSDVAADATVAKTDALISFLETEMTSYAANDSENKGLLKDALVSLDLMRTVSSAPDPDPNPGTGGGGGGGGGGDDDEDEPVVTPEEPEVTPPAVDETTEEETVVNTEVENAAEVVQNEDGSEEATVDDTAASDAIDSVVDTVKQMIEDSEEGDENEFVPLVTLSVPAETMDVSVAMGGELVEKLNESEVNLCLDTGGVVYNMPAQSVASESLTTADGDPIEGDFDVEFNSQELAREDVIDKIDQSTAEGAALAEAASGKTKIIEISIDIVQDEEVVGGVHNFEKPITITLSLEGMENADPDKLGVYYMDEETGKPVFMSGRVVTVNGVKMIELVTDHLSQFAILEVNVTYTDIASHWSKKFVESMGSKHIISGYPDGTFLPEKAVTRAEFAKMIVEAMGYDAAQYDGAFSDVDEGDWYAGYIAAATEKGVLQGYPDGTFKPETKITRLVMATMLTRAQNMELGGQTSDILSNFADKQEIAEWGEGYAAKAVESGLMNGMDGNFKPEATTTRAQAATAIYRLYNK